MRERKKHQSAAPSKDPNGWSNRNLGVCPDQQSNPQPFRLRGAVWDDTPTDWATPTRGHPWSVLKQTPISYHSINMMSVYVTQWGLFKNKTKQDTHPGWCGSVDSVWAENQRVASSIPSQGTCLGCRPGPQYWAHERQPHIDVSLPLFPLLVPSL